MNNGVIAAIYTAISGSVVGIVTLIGSRKAAIDGRKSSFEKLIGDRLTAVEAAWIAESKAQEEIIKKLTDQLDEERRRHADELEEERRTHFAVTYELREARLRDREQIDANGREIAAIKFRLDDCLGSKH